MNEARGGGWRVGLGGLMALVALVGLAFAPVVLGERSFCHSDLISLHHPWWEFAGRSIRAGQAPFWLPGMLAGFPLHAQGEAALLYPLTAPLHTLLPSHRAIDAFVLVHLVLAGAFTACYLRELRVPRSMALFGAVAFCLSGRMLGSTIWPGCAAVSAYLPLALLGCERLRRDRRQGVIILALALGLAGLAGRPQRFVPLMLLVAPYGLHAAWRGEASLRRHRLAAFGAALLLGAGLGAAQTIPTLSFATDHREPITVQEWEETALGADHLAALTLPPSDPHAWADAWGYPGVAIYLGLFAACVLGVRRLRAGRRPDSRWLVLLAVGAVCLWLAPAGPGSYTVAQSLPILRSMRAPARFIFPLYFIVVVAGTVGLAGWLRARSLTPRTRAVLLAAACLELVFWCRSGAPVAPVEAYTARHTVLDRIDLAARDVTGARHRLLIMAPSRWNFRTSRVAIEASTRLAPAINQAIRYGEETAMGNRDLAYRWQTRAYETQGGAFLRQLGVRWIISEYPQPSPLFRLREVRKPLWIYEFEDPLPRGLFVARWEHASSFQEAQDRANQPGFPLSRLAVVEGAAPPPAAAGTGTVRLLRHTPGAAVWEVDARSAGGLVVFETWAPGWSVAVNGQEAPLLRANGMFRFVPVPAGRSRVEFLYRPPGLAVGASCGAAALLALLLLALFPRLSPKSAGARDRSPAP